MEKFFVTKLEGRNYVGDTATNESNAVNLYWNGTEFASQIPDNARDFGNYPDADKFVKAIASPGTYQIQKLFIVS